MTETNRNPILARPTEAETRVLDKLIEGLSNEEISSTLHIAENTVKTHLRRATRDVRARNRTDLAVIYTKWKYGKWDLWPRWDARRRNHSTACAIFKDTDTCDCTKPERRDSNTDH